MNTLGSSGVKGSENVKAGTIEEIWKLFKDFHVVIFDFLVLDKSIGLCNDVTVIKYALGRAGIELYKISTQSDFEKLKQNNSYLQGVFRRV